MALWKKIKSRGKVEDRRGMPLVAKSIGGISITGLAVLMIANLVLGGDLGDVANQINSIQYAGDNTQSSEFEGEDEYEIFASTILGSNNDMWREVFDEKGWRYNEPKLVLFRQATQSSCGIAASQIGPHYCSLDSTIYLDETFFEELTNRFGAEGGDVAEAYVIAHEVAHHVQNELGIMDQIQSRKNSGSEDPNELTQNLELQADCFSGVWAGRIEEQNILLPGEIKEAMDAAAAVGDDRIQKQTTGTINPETWTHGSSEERVKWFTAGFNSKDMMSCTIN